MHVFDLTYSLYSMVLAVNNKTRHAKTPSVSKLPFSLLYPFFIANSLKLNDNAIKLAYFYVGINYKY